MKRMRDASCLLFQAARSPVASLVQPVRSFVDEVAIGFQWPRRGGFSKTSVHHLERRQAFNHQAFGCPGDLEAARVCRPRRPISATPRDGPVPSQGDSRVQRLPGGPLRRRGATRVPVRRQGSRAVRPHNPGLIAFGRGRRFSRPSEESRRVGRAPDCASYWATAVKCFYSVANSRPHTAHDNGRQQPRYRGDHTSIHRRCQTVQAHPGDSICPGPRRSVPQPPMVK